MGERLADEARGRGALSAPRRRPRPDAGQDNRQRGNREQLHDKHPARQHASAGDDRGGLRHAGRHDHPRLRRGTSTARPSAHRPRPVRPVDRSQRHGRPDRPVARHHGRKLECATLLAGMEPLDLLLRDSGQYGARVPMPAEAPVQQRLMASSAATRRGARPRGEPEFITGVKGGPPA